jgi:two-component system response regulator QseB
MRLLIVEDDDILRDGLKVGLALAGFTTDAVGTCEAATAALDSPAFDAVVLDLMLPDGSGLDILKSLRSARNQIPVLLLTARDTVADRISGLDSGADDYLGKPFDLDEVAARLRALTRRSNGRSSADLKWGDLMLMPSSQTVEQAGRQVRLSRREFTILQSLMSHPGAILSRAQLEDKLYGWQEEVESNTIEVHIHHLRSKLGPGLIETVRGLGYRLGSEL